MDNTASPNSPCRQISCVLSFKPGTGPYFDLHILNAGDRGGRHRDVHILRESSDGLSRRAAKDQLLFCGAELRSRQPRRAFEALRRFKVTDHQAIIPGKTRRR